LKCWTLFCIFRKFFNLAETELAIYIINIHVPMHGYGNHDAVFYSAELSCTRIRLTYIFIIMYLNRVICPHYNVMIVLVEIFYIYFLIK
jgi:hypothetical protein